MIRMHIANSHRPQSSPRIPTRRRLAAKTATSASEDLRLAELQEQQAKESDELIQNERAAHRAAEVRRKEVAKEMKQRHEKQLAELKQLRAREFAEARTQQRADEIVEQRLQGASQLEDEIEDLSGVIERLEVQRAEERKLVEALENQLIARRANVGTLTAQIHTLTKTLQGKQRRAAPLYPRSPPTSPGTGAAGTSPCPSPRPVATPSSPVSGSREFYAQAPKYKGRVLWAVEPGEAVP